MNTQFVEQYLKAGEVAARLGCSIPTIWRRSRDGHMPRPVRFSPGCTRWRLSEILAYERDGVEGVGPEAA
jgi:predicted DNA-binding transcriptional regulator AlpA